ncbi:MAG: ABC transporter permease [Oscillospiraceae bacterium]
MFKYIIKRILLLIPVLLGVSLVIFTIMYFVPGDPARTVLQGTSNVTEEMLEAKREEMGLNDPFIVQFGRFLKQTFIDFDMGQSYITKTPVSNEIASRYPKTLSLALCCMLMQIIIGIPLGILAATHQNGIVDRICILITILGISLPQFWVALMLVAAFSLKLHILPAFGFGTFKHLILPVISLSLNGISTIARLTRSSMLEVIRSDYVVTARSKGLKESRIILVHALPNSIIPVIQSLGTSFGSCLGGAVVIENIFSIAGMGTYLTTGVNNLDYPIVRSCVIILALSFSVVMLIVDLMFAFVDPRIKAQYSSGPVKKVKKVKSNA